MKKKGRIGGSFDDFLKEEGLYEAVTARARKRVLARRKRAAGNRPKKRRSAMHS